MNASTRIFVAALFMTLILSVSVSAPAQQAQNVLRYVGFSPVPPADKLECRLAVAYAVNRDAIASALSARRLLGTGAPAYSIQSPRLPGYDASTRSADGKVPSSSRPGKSPPTSHERWHQRCRKASGVRSGCRSILTRPTTSILLCPRFGPGGSPFMPWDGRRILVTTAIRPWHSAWRTNCSRTRRCVSSWQSGMARLLSASSFRKCGRSRFSSSDEPPVSLSRHGCRTDWVEMCES